MIHIRSLILLVFGTILVVIALRNLRAQKLKEEYALLYIFVGMPYLVLAFWPDGIVRVSDWLEIEKPTVLVLAMGSFLLLILFKLTLIVSVQDQRINTLTHLLAILMEQRSQDVTAIARANRSDDSTDSSTV